MCKCQKWTFVGFWGLFFGHFWVGLIIFDFSTRPVSKRTYIFDRVGCGASTWFFSDFSDFLAPLRAVGACGYPKIWKIFFGFSKKLGKMKFS